MNAEILPLSGKAESYFGTWAIMKKDEDDDQEPRIAFDGKSVTLYAPVGFSSVEHKKVTFPGSARIENGMLVVVYQPKGGKLQRIVFGRDPDTGHLVDRNGYNYRRVS
jgi:hypothetical protein